MLKQFKLIIKKIIINKRINLYLIVLQIKKKSFISFCLFFENIDTKKFIFTNKVGIKVRQINNI